jgi:hypothetical protein
MTYTYEIYDSKYGKGFKIYLDGSLIIDQPFKPGVEGFVGMSEQEAREEAERMIYSLEHPPTTLTTSNLLTLDQVNYIRNIDPYVRIVIYINENIVTNIYFSRELTQEEINDLRGML